ncbi:hypothetical protein ABZP36_029299 [Zizania latifolia]
MRVCKQRYNSTINFTVKSTAAAAATKAAATPVLKTALPPSSAAAGPGYAAGESEAVVGSGGLSAIGLAVSSVDGASADGSSTTSPLSGDGASSEGEEEGLDEPLGALVGAFPGVVALVCGDSALDPGADAWVGGVSDLMEGALAGVALGGAVRDFSDFSGAAVGAFDGDPDEDDDFGEAAGVFASAASATAADATRRTATRARARAMVHRRASSFSVHRSVSLSQPSYIGG